MFYKLNVKRDLIEARGASIKALMTGRSTIGSDDIEGLIKAFENDKDNDRLHRGTIASQKEYAQFVLKYKKRAEKTNVFFAYEEDLFNFKTDSFIIEQIGDQALIHIAKANHKPTSRVLPYKSEKIVTLKDALFALKIKDQEGVVRIEANFNKKKCFKDKVVYQEFRGKIVQINGDKNKLYSMIKLEGRIHFKVFMCRHNDFDFLCQIDNIDTEHP